MTTTLLAVALIFGVIFVLFILAQEKKSGNFGGKSKLDKALIAKKWQDIEALASAGQTHAANTAVMEADKLFDHVLKSVVGANGTMADRLKAAKSRFASYDVYQGVWEAHKLRNRLAHDLNSEVPMLESKRALEKFKKGLRELKSI